MRLPTLIAIVLLAGCGELTITPGVGATDTGPVGANNSVLPDGGPAPTRDMGPPSPTDTDQTIDDVGPIGADGGEDVAPAVCDPMECGTGASCQNNVCTCDAGLLGDPFVGCSMANPCENVNCPDGASCNPDGTCSCDPFFSGDPATGCNPTPPAANLAARTTADVCAIWNSTYQRASNDFWMIEPAAACDPGVLHPEEQRTALHETSRYRMLVGLNPVSHAAGRQVSVQDCAMMHDAENPNGLVLNHTPPNTWACYTQDGYDGCSSSNLAGGIQRPAGTVSLYIQDSRTPSLGHRRWIFNPGMGRTAFGHVDRYGAMYSFDGSRNHNPEFVAYPAPGPFPKDAMTGKWSIHGGASYTGQHTVTVTNMGDGSDVPVSDVTAPVFGNLASTLSWTVSTSGLPVDVTYRITIRDGGGALVREYDTTLVDCP